jgi:uncharacterized protein (TIGR03437 family)
LNQTRLFVLAMIMSALVAPLASAQTVASVSVVSGNGQLICEGCVNSAFQFFDNLTVRVADANNNAVVGAVVNWTEVSGLAVVGNATSVTDSNGLAFTSVFATPQYGTLSFTYAQNTIVATSGNYSATFTLTQALPQFISTNAVPPVVYDFSALANLFGNTVTGTASSAASFSAQITVGVESSTGGGGGIPNVSVRLVNVDGTSGPSSTVPSLYCPTAAGADPYSILTGPNGYATCNAVFGGVAGNNGTFAVLLGGIAQNNSYSTWTSVYATSLPVGVESNFVRMNVAPAIVGSLTVVSGNSQVANPGKALGVPLVVTVTGPSGNVLSGQTVNWTASPATAGIFGSTSATTGSNGQASNTFTISATFTGTFTITATAATKATAIASFTETSTAPVTVTGISIFSGNNQSALVNTAFANPLIVQVNSSTSAPAVNTAVTFTVTSGAAVVSSSSVATNSSGQAQVTVAAGSTYGAVNVTASASGYSVVFALAVVPAGPSFTSVNFYNGADFQRGSISPCGIAALIASNIAPSIQGTVAASDIGAVPYALGGDSLTVNGAQAPIYSVSNNSNGTQQLNFQMPCSVAPGSSVPVTVTVSGGSATSPITVLPASPGVFQTTSATGTSLAVIERPDGSFVSSSNPARAGETVTAFVTGLGPTLPSVGTDALPIPGTAAVPTGPITVGVNNAGVPLTSAQLSPDLLGVSEVTFQVPSSLASTTGSPTSYVFSIGVTPAGSSTTYYSAGTYIPIQ